MANDSSHQRAARHAAATVAAARDVGDQLGLFGGDPEREALREARAARGRGRPKGSRNAVKTGLAEWMAAQGYRAPGSAVALAAGLTEDGDGLEVAFRRAVWLQQAAIGAVSPNAEPAQLARVAGDLMAMTFSIWREQNAQAAALLPYTLRRLGPDDAKLAAQGATRPRIGIAAPSRAGLTGRALLPADMRAEIEAEQAVSDAPADASDDAASDGSASD